LWEGKPSPRLRRLPPPAPSAQLAGKGGGTYLGSGAALWGRGALKTVSSMVWALSSNKKRP